MKIAILGAGVMATALTTPLTDNGHEVALVGTHLYGEIIESIRTTGRHPNLGLVVPPGVTAHPLDEAAAAFEGATHVLSGVNSFGVDWAGERLAGLLRPGMHVIAIAKGIQADDQGSFTILPDVLAGKVPEPMRSAVSWTAIAGPSIAGELAVRRHTSVVFASREEPAAQRWREVFATSYYHVRNSDDLLGVEVCACTKNCYALGLGFMGGVLDAEGPVDHPYVNFNYGAALFGQASIEMRDFVTLLGGDPSVVLGLPGIGDCFVTSMGGRNVRIGRLVGAGLTFSQARATMPGVTLEGAAAIVVVGAAVERLTERGVIPADRFPLLRHLHDVVARDAAVDIPWHAFFGTDGSGRTTPNRP